MRARWAAWRTMVVGMTMLATAACDGASSDSPLVVRRALVGEWRQPFQIPGSSTTMTLAVHDSTVAGDGAWAIEAGRSGTMTIAGTISGTQIALDMLRSDSGTAYFRGALVTVDSMAGIVYYRYPNRVGDPVGASFVRVK